MIMYVFFILLIISAFICLYFSFIRPIRNNILKKIVLFFGSVILYLALLLLMGYTSLGNHFTRGLGSERAVFLLLFPPIFVFVLLCFYFFVIRSIIRKIKRIKEKDKSNKIPDTCPHCKNPNPDKKPICEWCGNKIC